MMAPSPAPSKKRKRCATTNATTTTTSTTALSTAANVAETTTKPATTTKAQREEQLRKQLNLPDIPGIPLSLLPLYVAALRTTNQYLQHVATDHICGGSWIVEEEENKVDGEEDNDRPQQAYEVVNSILTRVKEQCHEQLDDDDAPARWSSTWADPALHNNNDDNDDTERHRQQQKKQSQKQQQENERKKQQQTRDKDEAIQSWRQALERATRDETRATTTTMTTLPTRTSTTNTTGSGSGSSSSSSRSRSRSPNNSHGSSRILHATCQHLWQLLLEPPEKNHGSNNTVRARLRHVTVQRAAQSLLSFVLRDYVESRAALIRMNHRGATTRLLEWMNALMMQADHDQQSGAVVESPHHESSLVQRRILLLQREGYLLWCSLQDHCARSNHPTDMELRPLLDVALDRFRQHSLAWTTTTTTTTNDEDHVVAAFPHRSIGDQQFWRRARDEALCHASEEERMVHWLVTKAYGCLDVLVPRMGGMASSSSSSNGGGGGGGGGGGDRISGIHGNEEWKRRPEEKCLETKTGETDDDDDDDEIIWEDGWDNDERDILMDSTQDNHYDSNSHVAQPQTEDHLAAVNRTIAAMQTMTNFQEGGLQVNLQATDDLDQANATRSFLDPEKVQARVKLSKIIARLATRHMPRLQEWVEGLTKADNLTKSNTTSSALVSLPSRQAAMRRSVLENLSELKRTVASVLSSAMKLGIRHEIEPIAGNARTTNVSTAMARSAPRLVLSLTGVSRNRTLAAVLLAKTKRTPSSTTKRNVATSRSNRIQIKLKKT